MADRVGISKQGVLRYVDNKDQNAGAGIRRILRADRHAGGLLLRVYSDPSAPHFPAYLRYLVKHKLAPPHDGAAVQTVLSVESLNPDHRLHDEFMGRMEDIWEHYSKYPWVVPPQLGAWFTACGQWCAKPWKSWMAFSCGGCANRKWTCVRNGPKWRICCFPRPSGMHAADFMCVPHTFGGDLTATLILLIFYCGSA